MAQNFMQKLAQALFAAAEDKDSESIREIVARACGLLRMKRLATSAQELLPMLETARLRDRGIISVAVSSAYRLSSREVSIIARYVSARTGGKTEIQEQADPNLIGGFRIRYGDVLVDATIRNDLKNLALHLTTKE